MDPSERTGGAGPSPGGEGSPDDGPDGLSPRERAETGSGRPGGPVRLTPLQGATMGLADAVPGVSGGTIALIFGIHPRLVRAISRVGPSTVRDVLRIHDADARRRLHHSDLHFLAMVGLGIVAGLVVGASLLSIVLESYPQALMAVLFGVVAASIHVPARVPRWRPADWAAALFAGFAAFSIAIAVAVVPQVDATASLWFLPVAGAIAACAMILPGISGSALLVLMGLYGTVIHAVDERDVVIIGLVGIGAVAGLLLFSRGLRRLLDAHEGRVHAAMVGLLVGSLTVLWPWRDAAGFGEGLPVLPDAFGPFMWALLGATVGVLLDRAGPATGQDPQVPRD